MRSAPGVRFYAYTKAVRRIRRVVAEEGKPDNLDYRFSLGGTEDHLLDLATDRHADVFPDVASLEAAGYLDQSASDLLAARADVKVGMPANRMPALLKRQGQASFGELQQARDAQLADKRRQSTTRSAVRGAQQAPGDRPFVSAAGDGLSHTP